MEAPLSSLIYGKGLSSHKKMSWMPEADEAFVNMKLALQSPPTLGLPDPSKLFMQTIYEHKSCMTSVVLQHHGDRLRPVANLILSLWVDGDAAMQRLPLRKH